MLDSASKEWITKNLPLFSEEVKRQALARLAVCKECPQLTPRFNRCKQCGCLMSAKVFFKKASCPLNKWGVMEGI